MVNSKNLCYILQPVPYIETVSLVVLSTFQIFLSQSVVLAALVDRCNLQLLDDHLSWDHSIPQHKFFRQFGNSAFQDPQQLFRFWNSGRILTCQMAEWSLQVTSIEVPFGTRPCCTRKILGHERIWKLLLYHRVWIDKSLQPWSV